MFKKAEQIKEGFPISLGDYEGIVSESIDRITFSYVNGTYCDAIKGLRESIVTFVCNSTKELYKVKEASTCKYEFYVKTPYACNPAFIQGGV